MKSFVMEVKVTEQDVGRSGTVNWLAISGWFGAARELYLLRLIPEGVDPGSILKMAPIATCEVFFRVVDPRHWVATKGEVLIFRVYTEKITSAATYLVFEVFNQYQNTLVAEGAHSLIFTTPDGKPFPVPDMIRSEAIQYEYHGGKFKKPVFPREGIEVITGRRSGTIWVPIIAETNCQGDVYWLNFLRQADRLTREVIVREDEFDDHKSMMVVGAHFRLNRSIFFGDQVAVETGIVRQSDGDGLRIVTEFSKRQDGQKITLATGYLDYVSVSSPFFSADLGALPRVLKCANSGT